MQMKKIAKFEITKEMEKNANIKLFKVMLFYWLCDLFYMACFIDSLVCKFVFGGLIMTIIFMNLSLSFSNPKEKVALERIGLVQDFLIGIGLTIYLIYIVPNVEVKEILIPVVAAVYGGLITLVGVAWTIRKSDKDRKLEEENKAKPLFTFNMLDKEPVGSTIKKLCVPEDLEIKFEQEVYAELENSEKSTIQLMRLFHDDKWFELQGNRIMLPNKTCFISFRYNSPLNIFLEVEDSLGKKYYYHLKVVFLYKMLGSERKFNTIREINEISETEMNKLIKEEPKHE